MIEICGNCYFATPRNIDCISCGYYDGRLFNKTCTLSCWMSAEMYREKQSRIPKEEWRNYW